MSRGPFRPWARSIVILSRAQPRPILLEALPVLAIALGAAAVMGFFGYGWLSGAALAVVLFVLWFFRNPEREIPAAEGAIVSPADGKVVEISAVSEDQFLRDKAVKIGIFMSPLDVHVNRVPYAGRILAIEHQHGRFLSAFNPKAPFENEQNAVLLETAGGKRILFVQIAGLLARRIVYWVRVGQEVGRGQRFGMIKFGSRMDLYLPPGTEVRVKPDDRVKAGSTIIGMMP